jgi:Protein of unknown function (DUF3455)
MEKTGTNNMLKFATRLLIAAGALPFGLALAQAPGSSNPTGDVPIATFHAEGAQIYRCQMNAAGRLSWQFREPIATLLDGSRTVGRHYAGPSWELADGTTLTAKVVARGPGATSNDIPWLKLGVETVKGSDPIATATTIRRLNTKGGVADGHCTIEGAFLNVPYSADYTFLRTVRD